jgi:cytochrome c556
MRTLPTRLGLALAGLCLCSLATAIGVALAADAEPEPVAGITNIMNAVNHDEHGLFGMIKHFCDKGGEASGDDWKLMRHRAQVVAESGNILMSKSPPRGGDDAAGITKWKQHCADFRDAAKGLSKALAFKKADRVKAALAAVAAQCEACHKDHRSN